MFESQNPEKVNIKNLSLEEPEKEGKTPEELREEFRDFLEETFLEWYADDATIAKIPGAADHLPELILPKDQNWQAKAKDEDPFKFGEYTINPETIDIDWGAIPPEKIKSVKLPDELNNKLLADVAEYIVKTYGADYYIPGLEYWKYILENPDKAPDKLKDDNRHFSFGSILCDAGGDWCVPYVGWSGTEWYWNARWLEGGWHGSRRIVLLEKKAVQKPRKDFLKPTPPMPAIRKF